MEDTRAIMPGLDQAVDTRQQRSLPDMSGFGLGFVYWLAFLLVLEPDNLLRAWHAGTTLPFGTEVLRIGGAAMLGALAAPPMLRLARRYPLVGARASRHLPMHIAANLGLAVALVVASCVLAAWVFEGRLLPTLTDLRWQLAANGTLLVFALSAFTAIAHIIQSQARSDDQTLETGETVSARIAVKTAGRLRYVDLVDVDWIEAQGNYVALHVGANTQLIRRTLSALESDLDPARYTRIHRSIIVTLDRIREMKTLANGDASLILVDGQVLRVSRRYREAVRERWAKLGAAQTKSLSTSTKPA